MVGPHDARQDPGDGARRLTQRSAGSVIRAPASFLSACTYAPSSCAASSRSLNRSRFASSRALPWSSGRTARASPTSPTRSSGRPDRWRPRSCAPRSRTTFSSRAAAAAPPRTSARSSCSSTIRTARARSPYSELSVARRLHRGGEGQYLLNRTAVRRIDLVELLADLGLGGGMHSIIGQGRVEEILGVEAGGAAHAARGGGRARTLQAPQASRRAEARARRDPGRARA